MLQEALAKKQALLDTVAGHLERVVASTKGPLRLLHMPSLLAPGVHSASAVKLPGPLFTVFSQLSAVISAFSLDVRVRTPCRQTLLRARMPRACHVACVVMHRAFLKVDAVCTVTGHQVRCRNERCAWLQVSLEAVSSTKDARKRKAGLSGDDQQVRGHTPLTPRRHHPCLAPVTISKARSEEYNTCGVQVVLSMHQDTGSRWFVIFAYYAAMDAVLARCSGSAPPPHILEALRPADLGDAWPTAPQEPPAVHLRSARPFRCASTALSRASPAVFRRDNPWAKCCAESHASGVSECACAAACLMQSACVGRAVCHSFTHARRWCQRLAGQDLRSSDGEGGVDLARYRQEKRALAFLSLLRLRHGHVKALQYAPSLASSALSSRLHVLHVVTTACFA